MTSAPGGVPPLPDDLVPVERRTFKMETGTPPHFRCNCGTASRFAERDRKLASKLHAHGCWVICPTCEKVSHILPSPHVATG